MTIPQEAIDLILASEGIDQPYEWPGGGSGITIGYGEDLGVDPAALKHWEGILTPLEISTLKQARGITGHAAKQIETRFRGIHITRQQAEEVFENFTLPSEIQKTLRAFPGVEAMPPQVLGAMVSLVYNRGTSIVGERRHEMRIIHEILAEFQTFNAEQRAECQARYIEKIAKQFLAMRRLWENKGLDGLLVRREAEAALVLSANHS